ncbi:MAG: PQQ-binding-like beta-propeller repeat protein [Acidimicrobiia bacterium]|nr:PQQ-binding-like beta-propeller repeat protein [Acidimicrobiia bacterium]
MMLRTRLCDLLDVEFPILNAPYAGTADGRIVELAARGCAASPCAPLWSARLPSPISTQPAVGGVVYTASADGALHAFAAAGRASATCRPLWATNAGSEIAGASTIVRGRHPRPGLAGLVPAPRPRSGRGRSRNRGK